MKLIYLPLTIMALSISLNGSAQKLPKTWTSTMKLTASYGGGMLYFSYTLVITDSVSYMNIISDKGEKNHIRKFTSKELNSILAFLEEHRFNKIKSESKGFAHDKASESILLTWDDHAIGASESAMMSITDEYKEDFNVVQGYLERLFVP